MGLSTSAGVKGGDVQVFAVPVKLFLWWSVRSCLFHELEKLNGVSN